MTFQAFFAIILLGMGNESYMRPFHFHRFCISLMAIYAAVFVLRDTTIFARVVKIVQVFMTGEAEVIHSIRHFFRGGLRRQAQHCKRYYKQNCSQFKNPVKDLG
jgi:hypothetical protein